jgi:hypothetical protein
VAEEVESGESMHLFHSVSFTSLSLPCFSRAAKPPMRSASAVVAGQAAAICHRARRWRVLPVRPYPAWLDSARVVERQVGRSA